MGRTTPGTTKRQPSQAMISNNPNTTCFAQTTRLQESLHAFTISNLHRDDNRNKETFFFFERHRTRISFSTCWIAKIRSSTPTSQETLNNNTEGEGGGEGRGNIPRRCSSPRACGLRNPPPATKPDKSNQSSTDGEREPKRKHEVEGRGADLGDVDRGGHQGGSALELAGSARDKKSTRPQQRGGRRRH